jgi:hypothetical protein
VQRDAKAAAVKVPPITTLKGIREAWAEKQEHGFVKWLNHKLDPLDALDVHVAAGLSESVDARSLR